jgi:hypothetical protein
VGSQTSRRTSAQVFERPSIFLGRGNDIRQGGREPGGSTALADLSRLERPPGPSGT